MASKKNDTQKGELMRLGIAGAALGALGAYLLYGSKKSKQHRARVRGWAIKAKGEVLEEVEKLKDINQAEYERIVAKVMRRYGRLKEVGNKELTEPSKELEGAWKSILKEVTTKKKTTRSGSGRKKKTTTKKK